MSHGIEDLPPAIKRWKTNQGFVSMWRKTVKVIYSPRILSGLPPFASRIAETFWQVDPQDVVKALSAGDVAFFVAFLLRIDQLDTAMVKAGRTIADRSPLIRCRYMVDGFMQAAIERLIELGGEWPLSAVREPDEAPA